MLMIDYAKSYAAKGWAVFPIIPRDKKPATQDGFKSATTDIQQIDKWWKENPNYNIGIATGETSNGLIVIDLDEDTEKGKHGIAAFDKWQQEHGQVPDTATVKTGRGGRHYYFYNHDGLRNKADLMGCIDIRANGGYIIAPPSVHPNGNHYSWLQSPDYHSVKDLTPQLLDFAKAEKKKDTPTTQKADRPERVSQGSRTSTLISRIGELNNKKLDSAAIKAVIIAENKTYNPPLSDEELAKEVFPAIERWQQDIAVPSIKAPSAADLMEMDIAPIRWAVNKLLPCGIGFLSAPPKYFKSFLALQVCIAICNGEKLFGQDTSKMGCLYFDLESTERRPRDRIKLMAGDRIPQGLYFITANMLPAINGNPISLANGFTNILSDQLQQHPDIGFVVIDVFQKIRTKQGKGQSDYAYDYQDIQILQKLAAEKNISILLVHHSRKMKDSADAFNNMSGSTAILGASDYSWVIDKDKRTDDTATLHITGRDIESQELSIQFDSKHFCWNSLGTAEEVQAKKEMDDYEQSPVIATIRKLMQDTDRWTGTATDIIHSGSYFQTNIYDKPQQVSATIHRFIDLLMVVDGIQYDFDRNGKERTHIFIKNNN